MKKNYLFLLLSMLLFPALSFSQYFPTVTQPAYWFRADVAGDSVGVWENSVQANGSAILTNTGLREIDTINFNNSFIVTGTHAYDINGFSTDTTNSYSIFTVFKPLDTITEYGLWTLRLDSTTTVDLSSKKFYKFGNSFSYNDSMNVNPLIHYARFSWKDKDIDTTVSGFSFGGTDSSFFIGVLTELIIFDTKLSYLDYQKVQTYLSFKHGVGIYSDIYRNSNNDTIWDNSYDSLKYKYNVIGIGRDTDLNIFRKQSTAQNGDKSPVLYFNYIEELNQDNSSFIGNNNFLMWGHNGGAINSFRYDSLSVMYLDSIMERKWKVQAVGRSIRNNGLNIMMPTENLDTNKALTLLVNSTDDSYDIFTTTIYYPDSVDSLGNHYYFNVVFDSDYSGEDYFSFKISDKIHSRSIFTYNTPQNPDTQPQIDLEMEVYPNPSTGTFLIDIAGLNTEVALLQIVTRDGKVLQEQILSGATSYNLSKQINVAGNYTISIIQQEQQLSKQIIIQ